MAPLAKLSAVGELNSVRAKVKIKRRLRLIQACERLASPLAFEAFGCVIFEYMSDVLQLISKG